MSAPMNYPCLRCILEYLEANQRIRLSSRCPSIRKIEKLVPLHLELLDINSTTIRINECRYKPKKRAIKQGKGILTGDIVFSNETYSEDHSYHYRIKCSLNDMKDGTNDYEDDELDLLENAEMNEEVLKNFPEGVKFHHAMRWLGNFLLGGRTEITTRKLEIVNAEVLRLPVDFKIKKVDILETRQQFLDGISKFINPEVEKLVFSVYTTLPIRDHPLIQKAKKICIKAELVTVEELSFVHKNIEFQPELPEQWFEILVEKWLADGRDIGSKFSFGSNNEHVELELWYRIEKMFNGRTIYSNFENPRGEVSEDRVALQEELRKSHGVKDGKEFLFFSLEYLEANKRFRLSSRCPSIRKIERTIPLHLELLGINSNTIRMNDYRYTTKRKVMKHKECVLPGDIVFDNRRDVNDFSSHYQVVCSPHDIYDDKMNTEDEVGEDNNVQIIKNFPEGERFHNAMKWLGCHLFEKRSEITTKKLVIRDVKVLRLPTSFKIIRVGILETRMGYLDKISELIHPVLKEIIPLAYTGDSLNNHPLIQMAKKVCLGSGMVTERDLSFVHKNIELRQQLPLEYFEKLIRIWKTDGREIGSIFTFYSTSAWAASRHLRYFENKFNGRTIYKRYYDTSTRVYTPENLVALQEELRKSHRLKEGRDVLYCTCLPINSTSELQISLSQGQQGIYPSKIILEVVQMELWPTLKSEKVEHKVAFPFSFYSY